MSDVLDFFDRLGSGLIATLLGLVWFAASIYIGIKIGERRQSAWQGWTAGLLSAVILGMLIFPATDVLKRHSCKSAEDFEACVEGDGDGADYP